MATIEELFSALEKADAAGNKEDAQQIATMIRQNMGGQAEPKVKTDTGFTGAFSAGKERLKGDIAALAGRTGIMDVEAAERYKAEKDILAERMFKPTTDGWTESPFQKFKETVGGSLPYMAAPLAAGAATLALPEVVLRLAETGTGAGGSFTPGALGGPPEEDAGALLTPAVAVGVAAVLAAASWG